MLGQVKGPAVVVLLAPAGVVDDGGCDELPGVVMEDDPTVVLVPVVSLVVLETSTVVVCSAVVCSAVLEAPVVVLYPDVPVENVLPAKQFFFKFR